MRVEIDDELWTLEDVAGYLKLKLSTVYKNWKKMGIRPVAAYPGAKPRFSKFQTIRAIGAPK